MKTIWLKNPEEHDFPAALDYLELLYTNKDAAIITKKLKKAKTIAPRPITKKATTNKNL